MTPKQLESQTLKAFKAWRKKPDIEIETLLYGSGEWTPCFGPSWRLDRQYRIAPKRKTK